MRQAQYPAAKAVLDEILLNDPENYRAVDTMLALFMAQKQTNASVQWIRQHAARRPGSAAMQHVLAQWLAATGDSAGAHAAYMQAKSLDPKFKPAQLELAKMDLAGGNLESARGALNRLLADDPRDLPARMVLGAVEEQAEKPAEAMLQYRVVLAANPDHVVALNNLAFLLCENTKSLDEALSYAEKAYQLSSNSAAVNDTLGWIYYQKAMNDKAIEHLAAAVKLQPTAQRNLHLAMAYSRDGRDQLAQKLMNDAAKMLPDRAVGHTAKRAVTSNR
jgi:tetratricopeptide (TPR) repeat protein